MQSLAQMMRVLAATQAILFILGLSRAEAAAVITAPSNENVTRITPRKIIYEVDIDNFIDENMDTIRDIAMNLDPMKLDDLNFHLAYKIDMFLYTGWLQNIAELKRADKCKIRYLDKKFNIDLNFEWNDIAFDYRYVIKMFWKKREGDLHTHMTKLNAHIALEVNFNNYHITLKSLDLAENGKINISLEGHLFDKLYNLIIKAVTNTFRTITLNIISENCRKMIMHRIDEINIKLGSMVNNRQFTFVDLTKSTILKHNTIEDNHHII